MSAVYKKLDHSLLFYNGAIQIGAAIFKGDL
jgi:hypothetical protein